MAKKSRVVVGMSGGVDSSVAAALLLREGWEVIGVTLKMWPQDCLSLMEDKCCGPQAVSDARGVAAKLGIPHYVIDETKLFEKEVIDYFSSEYRSGHTPNPCVMCNQKLKFGNLLTRALALGATHVATGHYSRVEKVEKGHAASNGGGWILKRALDRAKDQSYFLFTLSQEQLRHILMPIGGRSKEEVRSLARELNFSNATKEESQDICFVPEDNYASFLKARLGSGLQKGEIVHRDGRVLGRHEGIELYTVGQRKGINVGSPKPLYVLEIEAESRRVIVGDEQDLLKTAFHVLSPCWGVKGAPEEGKEVQVKVRHGQEAVPATLHDTQSKSPHVVLKSPLRAITPGQAAVFYREDEVMGGGWIATIKN